MIHSKTTDDVINQALKLICNRMPQSVSKDLWESVSENFSQCEEKLELFLEADSSQNKTSDLETEVDLEDVYIPIYEMCGISLQTLEHCYAFGQSLYEKKEFANSKLVMLFLMKIAPEISEFWISAAMCDKQMGNYDSAINIYKLAEAAFPDNPSLYLYCADNCIARGDITNAKIQLDAAKNVFSLNADAAAQWQPTYEYLLAKAA